MARSVQLAVPLAWELAPVRGVPQAVPRAEQDDQQAAQSVPCELPAARLIALPDDPQAVHLEPAYSSAVQRALPLAARSGASPCDPLGGPQDDC